MLRQLPTKINIYQAARCSRTSVHLARAFNSTNARQNLASQTTANIHSRLLLAGLGIAAGVGLLAYPLRTTIHDDSDVQGSPGRTDETVKTVTSRPALEIYNLSLEQALHISSGHVHGSLYHGGIRRIDTVEFSSNTPCEDRSSVTQYTFSPTLVYSVFGVYDGHVGAATAQSLQDLLPLMVSAHLADVYSQYANVFSESDIPSGYTYKQITERNPGELPNPRPPAEKIDSAIKTAFLLTDDMFVHWSAQKALGLSDDEYHALQNTKPTSEGENPPLINKSQAMYAVEPQDKKPTRAQALRTLQNAYAGSCALLAIYDKLERTVRVALTGDSRAVLGRRVLANGNDQQDTNPRYIYQVHELSTDQTAKNPTEAARLTALHPDEPELLKNGRTLGWGPSRAFGDGVMKWSLAVQKRLWEECLGDRPRSEEVYKTPPYFTAEPEVTTFKGVRKGDFLVLASDGLWDCLEKEEVVGLVGRWLEERGVKENISLNVRKSTVEVIVPNVVHMENKSLDGSSLQITKLRAQGIATGVKESGPTYLPSELPVVYPETYKDTTPMYKYWRANKRFVSAEEDKDNVAKHLLRNAIGGADRDLSEALHLMEGSRRRRFKDDISIQVIFFE